MAVTAASLMGSAYLYRKVCQLESQLQTKDSHFEELIKNMELQTQSLTQIKMSPDIGKMQETLDSLAEMVKAQTGH